MIILSSANTSQSFYCIPRYYTADSLELTNELTQEVSTYNITTATDTHFFIITGTFNLVEDASYKLILLDGTTEVYRDKVYCTSQSVEDFSVNDNIYISHTTTNDFIIIS
jgi:hypothetical protein